MAMQSIRLRRFVTVLCSSSHSFISHSNAVPGVFYRSAAPPSSSLFQECTLFSSLQLTRCLSEGRSWKLYKEGDEITEDTVLFEGCDFNHWLITVDFPKDPKPTPEEMVATYERICAEGLNISIEEAKMKIYACSTTTYQGFQAVMTEAESEKFKDVPGVVFVLPDSYIDPVNKEYGGDKYENGVITPRPPPYNPQREQRRNQRYDRQRNFQNYDQNHSSQYNQQRQPPMQRNYGPPNFSQQNPNFTGRRDNGPPNSYPQHQYPPQGQQSQMPMNNNFQDGGFYPQHGNATQGGGFSQMGQPQNMHDDRFGGKQ